MQAGTNGSGQTRSLAAEPMPSGASTSGGKFARDEDDFSGGGGEFPASREPGSMVSTEPRV
jgi:hypothetical protein